MADDIERSMRNFLWEGNDEWRCDHLVAWNEVYKPKEFGGLGIGNILKGNKALLIKWLWSFPLEQEPLWEKVIKSKCGLRMNN